MSVSAQPLRLRIRMEPAALPRIWDRFAVMGLIPQRMTFCMRDAEDASLLIVLDGMPPDQAENLIARLAQIPAVRSVTSGSEKSFS